MGLIILIIVLVLIFGGGGGYYGYNRWVAMPEAEALGSAPFS